jgi:hypothetical protein
MFLYGMMNDPLRELLPQVNQGTPPVYWEEINQPQRGAKISAQGNNLGIQAGWFA